MVKVGDKTKKAIDNTLRIFSYFGKSGKQFQDDLLTTIDNIPNEQRIIELLTKPLSIYMTTDTAPSLQDINNVIDKEEIIVDERFHMPFIMRDSNGNGVLSNKKFTCLPLNIRRNQQISLKEGTSAEDSITRNDSGQVTGDSRSGQCSDDEMMQLLVQGSTNALAELYSSGSSNLKAKEAVRRSIQETGSVSLNDINIDAKDDMAILKSFHMLRALGIDTNILGTEPK